MSRDDTPPIFTLEAGFAYAANLFAMIVNLFGAPEAWLKLTPLTKRFVSGLKNMIEPLEDLVRLLLIARAHQCEAPPQSASRKRIPEQKSVEDLEQDRVFASCAYRKTTPLLPTLRQEQRGPRFARVKQKTQQPNFEFRLYKTAARETEIAFLARRFVTLERMLAQPDLYARALARRVQNWGPIIAAQLHESFPPSCAQTMLVEARKFVIHVLGARDRRFEHLLHPAAVPAPMSAPLLIEDQRAPDSS